MLRMLSKRISLLLATAATAALMLNGCSDGKDGANGTNATNTNAPVNAASLTSAQFADLQFSNTDSKVTSVTIINAPVVNFKVTDASGNPVVGLGKATSKSATATVASYPNVAFSLAKLVPGTTDTPSKWVNYIVTTVPSTTTAATAGRPSSDSTGTLVDNGDGTYQYTFYRDITKIKDQVAGFILTGNNKAADLGDLTYEPNLTHRLCIQISGNAPGTGTNTPNAVQVTPGVPMQNPLNIVYDFIPASGKVVAAGDVQREITLTAQCNECHGKLGGIPGSPQAFHGGSRIDTRYCVVCHSDQRKYGNAEATTTFTGYTGSARKINNQAVGDFPTLIHKVHMGEELTKTGYDYAGVKFNEVTYPQPVTNCVKCHTNSAAAPQGDNWKNAPSRLACGACHDGINWATGTGTTLAGATTGHAGGAATTDAACAACHPAVNIPLYHATVDLTGANGRGGYPLNTALDVPTPGFPTGQGPSIPLTSLLNPPVGVYKIGLEIKQATIAGAAGAHKATVIYRILKDGLPVTLDPAVASFLIPGVDGSPDIYLAYGLPQDGLTASADWTNTLSFSVKKLRDGIVTVGTQTGPDTNGWYTASLATIIPDAANMVTAGLGIQYNGFVQLNLPAYPKGIRLRENGFAMKLVDGQTARRPIVSNAKCNACHGQLGVKPSFHSGARNNGEGCAFCHTPNLATGHIGAANGFGGGWSVSTKDLIHGIHASGKRTVAYTYEATAANPGGFAKVTYPGILRNCEQCHVTGSYDFSNTASQNVLSNLLWSTVAKGNMTNDAITNPTGIVPIGLSSWILTLGRGQVDYTGAISATVTVARQNNLVISPITAACFGCHDTNAAVGHMKSNGGVIYGMITSFNGEACLTCHGPGKPNDIKLVHAK